MKILRKIEKTMRCVSLKIENKQINLNNKIDKRDKLCGQWIRTQQEYYITENYKLKIQTSKLKSLNTLGRISVKLSVEFRVQLV